jgi:hypothetical protein
MATKTSHQKYLHVSRQFGEMTTKEEKTAGTFCFNHHGDKINGNNEANERSLKCECYLA